MKIITETERLILREFEISDASSFYALNASWEVLKYTGDVAFNSVDDAESLIKNYSDYRRNGFGRNTVLLKPNLEVIGWCGLKKHEDGMIDLGYRFFEKDWNKGYATEASEAMLEIGFEEYGIKEIVGRTDERNLGSIRVLEKIGMEFWKKDSCEGIEDSMYYKIRQGDWKKKQPNNK